MVSEFDPFGVGQGLQGRGVPAAPPFAEDGADCLFGDPGFSGAGGGHDQTVGLTDRFERVRLKRVRPKRRHRRLADSGEDRLQRRLGLRFHHPVGVMRLFAMRRFSLPVFCARPAGFSARCFPGGCFMNHGALYHRRERGERPYRLCAKNNALVKSQKSTTNVMPAKAGNQDSTGPRLSPG
jgi:hypothetical protein